MTIILSMGSYRGDNGNQGNYPIVKCSSWLLHDKVASYVATTWNCLQEIKFLLDCILLKPKSLQWLGLCRQTPASSAIPSGPLYNNVVIAT